MRALYEIGQHVKYEGWRSLGFFSCKRDAILFLRKKVDTDNVSVCDYEPWEVVRHGPERCAFLEVYDEPGDELRLARTVVAQYEFIGEWSDCGNHHKVVELKEVTL